MKMKNEILELKPSTMAYQVTYGNISGAINICTLLLLPIHSHIYPVLHFGARNVAFAVYFPITHIYQT
jgi:hypothetical protein